VPPADDRRAGDAQRALSTAVAERIGILGGTFDPPHIGHLLLAQDALEQLALDRLVLLPASRQPLKESAEMTAPAHRLAMVRLLAALDPRLDVEAMEVERAGLSFTVDTLRALAARHPSARFVLVMGEDTAATLPQWRDTAGIAALAEVAVAVRGEQVGAIPAGFRSSRLKARRVDVSATEIRARVAAGKSVRGLVPEDVAAYIAGHGLYRTTSDASSTTK
jgi:nicotinate-nucleotide adenylyltransferase